MNSDETNERADLILDAVETLVRLDGADGWSLADLADRAGVSLEEVESEFESEWEAFCYMIRRDEARFEAGIRTAPYRDQKERFMRVLEACVPDYDWTFWVELWSLALRERPAVQKNPSVGLLDDSLDFTGGVWRNVEAADENQNRQDEAEDNQQ